MCSKPGAGVKASMEGTERVSGEGRVLEDGRGAEERRVGKGEKEGVELGSGASQEVILQRGWGQKQCLPEEVKG